VVAVEDPSGQRLADELGRLALQLYPDRELRKGNEPGISPDLRRRFKPPPVPVLAWGRCFILILNPLLLLSQS
jgi:hypothetical protein